MAKLTFPVDKDGLLVDVVIGLPGAATTALLAAGQPVIAPICTRGEIDTGTNVSAVSSAILQKLGVPARYKTSTQTVAGIRKAKVYEVSLGISDFTIPGAPELVESTLHVMELIKPLPTIEVLIGLAVLLKCKFVLDGPGAQFTLEF